ncbi:two-component system, sensor histidine kinase YesM [Paenibacillus sp. UNCCL117]|uniref:cache domain-containing sensor histidine kinase n=1 Tax=unclassified Paenibacillus TaxID=185978 RepID=UPI000886485C|nr:MULTISPECIES: sensor histidine kinase [unclassified Paenibacillus]SDE55442.1 two-component system, sensor histidine kinase YesM [Paenibacillus sp. cl123]SFW66441.1 two-component system, sensor histidine kinase YesM [Paenibacillus sp. UNCCL117]
MRRRPTVWTYIRNYKFNSIFIKNFIVVFVLLMVPLACVHYLVFDYNDSTLREEVGRANAGELTRIRDTVDIIMAEAESLGIRLGSAADVELFLAENKIEYPLSYSTISRFRRIQEMLGTSILTNPYVETIHIYSRNGQNEYLLSPSNAGALDKFEHRWWFDEYVSKKDEHNFWISTLQKPVQDTSPIEHKLVLFRKLSTGGGSKEGLLTVTIGAKQLTPLLKEITPEQEIYILDREGNIVYTQDQRFITESIELHHPELPHPITGMSFSGIIRHEGSDRIVSAVPSSRGAWTYLSIVPLERFESRQNQLRSFIYLLVAIGVGSSFLIAFLITVRTYQPIQGILHLLESSHPPMRDFKSKASAAANEIKYIAATIMESTEQKNEMEQELQRRYEMMSKAQGIALQAQINPHMLYNTLEAINWKVMRLTNGKNEASVMIQALSQLLRLSLSTGENIIPLRAEMEHARMYVEVQQLHFKEKLEVIWKINGSILDYLTVKLTLQPIIENAIYHGIKPSARPGVISIIGYEETECVVLKIKDNGVGISQAVADKINQELRSEEIKENAHIGLSNVNHRIRLIFGENYGIRILGKEGEGTIVELRIPKRL